MCQILRLKNLPRRAVWVALGMLAALGAPHSSAFGAGNESMRRAHDLALTVDSRWAGGAHGGYYPIRLRVTNAAGPRELEFRFVDNSSGESRLPTVIRRVLVDQGATSQLTLSIPLVSPTAGGELRVYEKGRVLEQLTQHLALPEPGIGAVDRISLLVIHPSPGTIDCTKFEQAVQSLTNGMGANPSMAWVGGRWVTSARSNEYQVIAPVMLPDSWIDYTAVDAVAIPLATLLQLPAAARDALIAWTETGGTLLVTEVGEPGGQSGGLARLLETANRPSESQTWLAAHPEEHKPIPVVQSATGAMAVVTQQGIVAPQGPISDDLAGLANKAVWPVGSDTFSHVPLMAGQVYAFPGNPFPGAAIDWAWWLRSSKWEGRMNWTSRYGTSCRQRHPDFLSFLIPGVGAVPVLAFVVLISLFAVAIGPINYFVVWRRKQLYLLVLTIPAIAFMTSCALFGYSMIADGFGVQSRLRSFTILDQRSQKAVSFNRISLYAGLAPSAGLNFSSSTAVFPIWAQDSAFESGVLDWSDGQHLANGWLRSTTTSQFETVVHRVERGRVDIEPTDDPDAPEAASSLAWGISVLVVKDDAGRLFAGINLEPGGRIRLHPADDVDVKALAEQVTIFRPEAPVGINENDYSPFNGRSRRAMMTRWNLDYGRTSVSFSQSKLEQGLVRLTRVRAQTGDGGLPVRSYLATFRENPGIELGVAPTQPKAGVHTVLGYY